MDFLVRSFATHLDFSRLVENLLESHFSLISLISDMVFFFPCFVLLLFFILSMVLSRFVLNMLGVIRLILGLPGGVYVLQWGSFGLSPWRSRSTVPFCLFDCLSLDLFGTDSSSEVSGVCIAFGGLYLTEHVPLFYHQN